MRYTRNGQQVLLDGEHFADAASETAAMMILNALLALDEQSDEADTFLAEPLKHGETRETIIWGPEADNTVRHIQRREADEYACSCGLRWDIGEDDPH